MLAAALAYAADGLAIFPLKVKGKAPLIAKEDGGNGHNDATTDRATITRWWTADPLANIGGVPGSVGCVAVDVDTADDEATATALGLYSEPTHVVSTGKGVHLWFRYDGPNVAALAGIVARASGGYVVMPPSVHASGATYRAESTHRDAAPLPPLAVAALRAARATTTPTAPTTAVGTAWPPHTRLQVQSALTRLSAGEYDLWLKVGMACHHEGAGHADGFQVWSDWSDAHALENPSSRKLSLKERRTRWARFGTSAAAENPVTLGTIYRAARAVGWIEPAPLVDLSALDSPRVLTAPVEGDRTIKRTSELLSQPRTIPFLVDQLLPMLGLIGLWAASNVGKSFLALDLCLHIALGWPWHGRAVRRGAVLYIFGEGAFGMAARVAAWCEAHDVAPAALDPWIVWRDVPLNITSADLRARVAAELAALTLSPDLIVLDTLAANSPAGFDENSTPHMVEMMRAAGELQAELGTAVMLVHHTGHDQSRERGNYAFRAACDVSLHLQTDGKAEDGRTPLRLRTAKARDFATHPGGIALRLRAAHGAAIIEPAPDITALTGAPATAELVLLQCLADAGGELSFTAWLAAAPFGRTKFNTVRDGLLKHGLVDKPTTDGAYLLTDDGRDHLTEAEMPEPLKLAS